MPVSEELRLRWRVWAFLGRGARMGGCASGEGEAPTPTREEAPAVSRSLSNALSWKSSLSGTLVRENNDNNGNNDNNDNDNNNSKM